MLEGVRKVLMEVISVNEGMIELEADLGGSLGANSLAVVELSLRLEAEFNIHIEDKGLARLITVADIVSLLESRAWVREKPGYLGSFKIHRR